MMTRNEAMELASSALKAAMSVNQDQPRMSDNWPTGAERSEAYARIVHAAVAYADALPPTIAPADR